jgi:hypothetical protein
VSWPFLPNRSMGKGRDRKGDQRYQCHQCSRTFLHITQIHHSTILKLLVPSGEKSERIMAEKVRNVEVRDVELDESLGVQSARTKSGSGPKTIRISVAHIPSLRLSVIPSWS